MKTAYFDCFSGISGDMALGALMACGVDPDELRVELQKLHLPGWELRVQETEQNGIGALDVTVEITQEQGHGRHLHHIREILDSSELSAGVRDTAFAVFTRLAEAEAKVHQTTVERIHFHEVGAVDAIIDITGAAICLARLGVQRVACSPLPMGRGFAECMHGTIPLPAPATVEILRDAPVYGVELEGELVTPTGAALMRELASHWGAMPAMTVQAAGFGAGKKRFGARPNLLRVIIGEDEEDGLQDSPARVVALETNLDDFSPQFYDSLMDSLFRAGALDVYLTPVQMKKGRPGTLLTVLAAPELRETLSGILFRETTTLGVRYREMDRLCLDREWRTVQTPYGEIRIKVGRWRGEETTASPEYEDVRKAAEAHGVPVKSVYQAAMQAYDGVDQTR